MPTEDRRGRDKEPEANPGQRLDRKELWVDFQIRKAIEHGEFDNLPGAGKPIPGVEEPHDPDWWIKKLIERENITGVLPPALSLRTEDAELNGELDTFATEGAVRAVLDDFNARIKAARRQLEGGPPVITPLRDVEQEIAAWRERRAHRLAMRKVALDREREQALTAAEPRLWRWLKRLVARSGR